MKPSLRLRALVCVWLVLTRLMAIVTAAIARTEEKMLEAAR